MGAAEQQQFSQYPLRYGDGTLGAAIAQTRGGKDELVTPVALWELDDSSGLYLPPGLSQNPRRPRVDAQLSGSSVPDEQPLPVKVITQAHESWDFDDEAEITITAGAEVEEAAVRAINGFGRINVVVRSIPSAADSPIAIICRWQSVPGGPQAMRSAREPMPGEALNQHGTLTSEITTKNQFVSLAVRNGDTVDRTYHIHATMTIG